jgi:peroxiredoxin
MKRLLFSTLVAYLVASSPVLAQTFSISPEKPVGGEQITVTYDPKGGPLDGLGVDAVAYVFTTELAEPLAFDLVFDQSMSTTLALPKTAKLVFFAFENMDAEKFDDNGGKGYLNLVYSTDRATPVKDALGLKAALFNKQYSRSSGIKPDSEIAINLVKQELAANPAAFNDPLFASTAAALAKKQDDAALTAACNAQITKLTGNKKATDKDYRIAFTIATDLKDEELAKKLKTEGTEKFANGFFARVKYAEAFKAAKTVEEKVKIHTEATSKLEKDLFNEQVMLGWVQNIANVYGEAGDWVNFEKYFGQITDRSRQASILNNLAWDFSGESIEGEPKDAKKGLELAARCVALVEKEIEDLKSCPPNFSKKKWKKNMQMTLGNDGDTYALLLYKNGDYKNAMDWQTLACEQAEFANAEMNERYAAYFEKINDAKSTEKLLADFIAQGNASSKMVAQHKHLFIANNTLESAYEKYVASLEKEAKAKKHEALVKTMIDEAAPSFTLRNLKGEEVSLESMKGKVLVLDFWATWCGPCKASFPAMQMAVDKFADRKDVAFLFIDTWENGDNKEKQAGDFIASKSYTFNVLMDNSNEVVGKFGVSGIPTKFIVDGNGRIRFKSVGFSGNDKELLEELSLMIELAGGSPNP